MSASAGASTNNHFSHTVLSNSHHLNSSGGTSQGKRAGSQKPSSAQQKTRLRS